MAYNPWTSGAPSDSEAPVSRTHVIFNTDAYLKIYPYCKAILHSERVKDDENFEDVKLVALAVVFAELCRVANDLKQPTAIASRNLIDEALRVRRQNLESQILTHNYEIFASLSEGRKEDLIVEQALLTQELGCCVAVVTDETLLRLNLPRRGVPVLSVTEFLARFHWLTPAVIADIGDDIALMGEVECA
ncbi:hypothetical protein BIW11_13774, partial [Tropilaelaps mercedesae]